MFDISMLYENCSGSVAQRLAAVVAWRASKAPRLPAWRSRKSQTLYHRGTCEAASGATGSGVCKQRYRLTVPEAAHIFAQERHVVQPVSLNVGTYSGTRRRSPKFILSLAFH